MKGGDDDDDDVWNASAVILDIDSGVYTSISAFVTVLYVCSENLGKSHLHLKMDRKHCYKIKKQ